MLINIKVYTLEKECEYKTYIRRSERVVRFLNVLCMFNLRPVSRRLP